MAIKGLDQAIDNLSRVRKNAIPAASAMTINRVAITAINQSSSQVARETRVRRKLVKERSRLKRATVRNPNARIIVNRGDLPVIKLGIRMLGRRPNSILKAGQHRYQRAFIQRLNNGRWHVMQRLPQARYEEGNDDKGRKKRNRLPIQVVKIPMAAPLKQAFDENVDTVFCKNGDITNPELSGGKMPDAGRNMTWDLRAPAPTPSHLRATVAIKGSFRGAEF